MRSGKVSLSSFPLVTEGNGGWIPAIARASYKRKRSRVISGAWNNKKGKAQMKKTRIRATYLAGRSQDVGKYYYGETWTDENGEHFRVKFGKKIRTDKPWTFEEVRSK